MSAPASCSKFEEALRRYDPASQPSSSLASLRAHAETCGICKEKLSLWDAIDAEAPALRREWPSPNLMTKFAAALEEEKASGPRPLEGVSARPPGRFQWVPLAAAAALFVISMVGLQVFQSGRGREIGDPVSSKKPLLSDRSLDEVETAEANYVRSIEKLSALARTRIENPTTPLLVSYREKLLVLDSAIGEMRSQIDGNRFNTHLRQELLAMLQEKQRTLQQLMKEEQS